MKSHAMPAIMQATADHYMIRYRELTGSSQKPHAVRARQVGMYLAKTLTLHSFEEIGEWFNRDASTVKTSVDKVRTVHDVLPTGEVRQAIETITKFLDRQKRENHGREER